MSLHYKHALRKRTGDKTMNIHLPPVAKKHMKEIQEIVHRVGLYDPNLGNDEVTIEIDPDTAGGWIDDEPTGYYAQALLAKIQSYYHES
jgi:ribosomal protein S16